MFYTFKGVCFFSKVLWCFKYSKEVLKTNMFIFEYIKYIMYNDNYGNMCTLSNFQSKKKSGEGDKKPLSDTTHCQWESVIWKYRYRKWEWVWESTRISKSRDREPCFHLRHLTDHIIYIITNYYPFCPVQCGLVYSVPLPFFINCICYYTIMTYFKKIIA